ncbi:MAG: biotin/lipoyl-containing protein [Thermodesulfobacteriota bacterium]
MGRYQLTIGDKNYEIEVLSLKGEQAQVLVNGRTYEVKFRPLAPGAAAAAPPPAPGRPAAAPRPAAPPRAPAPVAPPPEKPAAAAAPGMVTAPMPGSILDVLVQVGDQVPAGATVVKLEAMKMENDLQAAISGVVKEVRVSKGDNVSVGDVLVVVSAD